MSETHFMCPVCGWRVLRRGKAHKFCGDKCRNRMASSRRAAKRLSTMAGGAIMVEPDWRHTTYQMDEADAAQYGLKTDFLGGVRFESREQIERTQARMDADGMRWRYDFGAFSRRKK